VRKPNQSPEPTTTAVTPRACARVAPAAVVAHLERWAKYMKALKYICVIGGALAVPFLALWVLGELLFGSALQEQRAARRFALRADEARLTKLIADCRALTDGRPLEPKPYEGGEYSRMWDEKSGYPKEFADLRPLRAFVGDDSVDLVVFKAFKDNAEIKVTAIHSESPVVTFEQFNGMSTTTKVLWPKGPTRR